MRFKNNSKPKTSALKVNPTLITIIVPPKCLQVIRLYSMLSGSSLREGRLLSRSHFIQSGFDCILNEAIHLGQKSVLMSRNHRYGNAANILPLLETVYFLIRNCWTIRSLFSGYCHSEVSIPSQRSQTVVDVIANIYQFGNMRRILLSGKTY